MNDNDIRHGPMKIPNLTLEKPSSCAFFGLLLLSHHVNETGNRLIGCVFFKEILPIFAPTFGRGTWKIIIRTIELVSKCFEAIQKLCIASVCCFYGAYAPFLNLFKTWLPFIVIALNDMRFLGDILFIYFIFFMVYSCYRTFFNSRWCEEKQAVNN